MRIPGTISRWIRSTNSSLTGAPAISPVRSADRSRPWRPGSRSSVTKAVGTPWWTVTRSRSMISSAAAGSVSSCSTSDAPATSVPSTPVPSPKTLNRVDRPKTTSSGPIPTASTVAAAVSSRLRWVSETPLGFPIVPEV